MPGLVTREVSDPIVASDVPFSFGKRLGLVFIIEAACLSLLAVLGLLAYIAYSAAKPGRQRRWALSTPLHMYFICMMFSELFQVTGSILSLKWVIDADVTNGPFCTAQGMLKQIGDVSVALTTLAIGMHTFCVIVFRWSPAHPRVISALVLSAIWFIIILIIVITVVTHKNNLEGYWGNTQYWCWITKRYEVQQYVLDYVFMWATAFANIILYIPLSLVIKGVIIVNGFRVQLSSKKDRILTTSHSSQTSGRRVDSIAMQMLFYPLIYTLTVLPIAIVRFRAFNDKHVPFAFTVVADVLFCLSGLFNVILFSCTRPSLLPRRASMFHGAGLPAISISSLGSPHGDRLSFAGRPSLFAPRTQIDALPDDSEIFGLESCSLNDHDGRSLDHSLGKHFSPPF